jgi:ATP-dependent RNA helicase DeaD
LEQLIRANKEADPKSHKIQAIILEPTRELASQVQTQVEKYTNLKSVLVYGGGASRGQQMRDIKKMRQDVLVCTPGRLIDLL